MNAIKRSWAQSDVGGLVILGVGLIGLMFMGLIGQAVEANNDLNGVNAVGQLVHPPVARRDNAE